MDDSLPSRGRRRAAWLGGVVLVVAAALPARAAIPPGTTADTALSQSNSVVKSPSGSQTSGSGAQIAGSSSGSPGPNGGESGGLLLPEPASLITCAIGCGLAAFAVARRRRRVGS